MLKQSCFRQNYFCRIITHITYIKRYSALDTSTTINSKSSIVHHNTKKKKKHNNNNELISEKKQAPSSSIIIPATNKNQKSLIKTNEDNNNNKYLNRFSGTYHFHRRHLMDLLFREETLKNYQSIRLSMIMKISSLNNRLFIENLFKYHNFNYIRFLFKIWGIDIKQIRISKINNNNNNNINFDSICLQTSIDYRNKESFELMFVILNKLLYEKQFHSKNVIQFDDIMTYVNNSFYNNDKYNKHRNELINIDTLKILQSFRHFVIHKNNAHNEKNPSISVWGHIDNILKLENNSNKKYFKKKNKFKYLQDTLIKNDFYHSLCLMYQIFGAKQNKNNTNNTNNNNNMKQISSSVVDEEENSLFIANNPNSNNNKLIDNDSIVLSLDSSVINILNNNNLLPTNLSSLLNKLYKFDNKYMSCYCDIYSAGIWTIYNNIQCINNLDLIILPTYIYAIISSMNNINNKRINQNNNIFQWLGANCYALNPRKKSLQNQNKKENENEKEQENVFDFNIIGIEGDIFNRRKLWYLLCYMPCILPSNYMKLNELSILCWLSSTILGWEYELNNYDSNNNENQQKLFESYCNEYRRIIRDILHCSLREDIIFNSHSYTLISRLLYIYLNKNIPINWLDEDWLMIAKLCPNITDDEYDNDNDNDDDSLKPLIFLTKILSKLSQSSQINSSSLLQKLKLLINDEKFVIRLSSVLNGNNSSYIKFLETLCINNIDIRIIDEHTIHLFMNKILLPSADFISAFYLLKFMMNNNIRISVNTISIFINICEYGNNTHIMFDIYNKLCDTLPSISSDERIIKSILRMFVKDNKLNWINIVLNNILNDSNNTGNGLQSLYKCYPQLINILTLLDKNNETNLKYGYNASSNKDNDSNNNQIIDKDTIINLLIDGVFNDETSNESLKRYLIKTFNKYKLYLNNDNNNKIKIKDDNINNIKIDKNIVYKMNILQDLIARSDNKILLNHWDKLIIRLQKEIS